MEKDPRRKKQNPVEKAQNMAAEVVAAMENSSKPSGKGKKVPLPTDIC